jgi:hypothetical protein
VAAFLIRRIGEGAMDAPRARKPAWPARVEVEPRERLIEREREEDFLGLAVRKSETFERYLKMPFGAAVERLSKGVGLKPDWRAWAA